MGTIEKQTHQITGKNLIQLRILTVVLGVEIEMCSFLIDKNN